MASNRASTLLTISEQVTYFFYAYLRISALLTVLGQKSERNRHGTLPKGLSHFCPVTVRLQLVSAYYLLIMQKALFHRNALRQTVVLASRRPLLNRFISTTASSPVADEQIVRDHTLPPKDVRLSSRVSAARSGSSLFSLDGRTVVVTGAGRGLGITLASAVLDAGGDVICLDVLPKPSEVEWSALTVSENHKGHATYYQCDITKEEQVRTILTRAASEASERKNPIRGLISCAGIQQMVDAIDYPVNDFKRILEVNVTGSFIVAKHIAGLIKDAKSSGSLVMIASMSGQIANRVCELAGLADGCS